MSGSRRAWGRAVVVGAASLLVLAAVLVGLYVLLHDVAPGWADSRITDPADRATEVGRVRTAVLAVLAGLIAVVSAGIGALSLRHASRVHRNDLLNESERRANELYAAAAAQLGSQHHAVRLAGLYSFERLADQEPDLRQVVVNVWCAYLRMPPERSTDGDVAIQRDREVRTTLQILLEQHLRRGDKHWPDLHVNLRGADLPQLNLGNAGIGSLDLRGATIHGPTRLDVSRVSGPVDASAARFGGWVSMEAAGFGSSTDFSHTEFVDGLTAHTARFAGTMLCSAATVTDAVFDSCAFERAADFSHASFESASFRAARFSGRNHHTMEIGSRSPEVFLAGGVNFTRAVFERLDFVSARFDPTTVFEGASVQSEFLAVNGVVRRSHSDPIRLDQIDSGDLWPAPEP